jgi:DNA repair protein SbcC/Rad50
LQASGCQVGVISHVDGIAERIGAVVEVRPEGSGQSRVVARGC